jgi:hypothetical protein
MVGMDEDELRRVNRIPAKMLVKAGSTLLVPARPPAPPMSPPKWPTAA